MIVSLIFGRPLKPPRSWLLFWEFLWYRLCEAHALCNLGCSNVCIFFIFQNLILDEILCFDVKSIHEFFNLRVGTLEAHSSKGKVFTGWIAWFSEKLAPIKKIINMMLTYSIYLVLPVCFHCWGYLLSKCSFLFLICYFFLCFFLCPSHKLIHMKRQFNIELNLINDSNQYLHFKKIFWEQQLFPLWSHFKVDKVYWAFKLNSPKKYSLTRGR